MPLYYSTSAPTANNKNSITRTASGFPNGFGIRDFLLVRNIQNPIRYPQLPTSINGSPKGGEPFLDTMVGSGVIIQQDPLEVSGVFRYANAIIMNHYKDDDPNAPIFLDIENITRTPIFPTSPQGIGTYLDEDIDTYGILAKSDFKRYRTELTLKNIYIDTAQQIDMADAISLQPVATTQQLPSYDVAYGQLTFGGTDVSEPANVIGSILNGQGVGVTGPILNGDINALNVVPNFDIRSSLAGRVLGITGNLNDTKLGTIGAQQLALALANNAAFNTQQAILGKLNVQQNINAIFGSGEFEFPRPNYKITVSDDLLGKAVGTAERILGFTVPKSRLDSGGSIFFTESGINSNTARANSMLTNTGKGQRKALSDQLKANLLGISEFDNPISTPFRSGYAPSYKKGGSRDFLVNGADAMLYAFNGTEPGEVYPFIVPATDEEPIPEISFNREKMVENAGFVSPPKSTSAAPFAKNFAWTSTAKTTNVLGQELQQLETLGPVQLEDTTQIKGDKKSLLTKTQKLFNSKRMKTMVSAHGSAESTNVSTQTNSAVSPNGFISKGSGVLSKFRFNADGTLANNSPNDSAENTFCRTWIPQDRYDKVFKLIRSRGLNRTEQGNKPILTGGTTGWRLHNSELMSVLDDNGFVKIAPYKTDDLTRRATLPKKYMFSIENLAWAGKAAANLLPIEQGPGDLLTGKFGRIMWFPPYDLTFSETSSVNLESNLFIGRGEPLYTYNNTERTGQLSFKIIVDHPSIMNGWKGENGPTDEWIRSWFAGCVDDDYFSSLLTREERGRLETRIKKTPVPDKVIEFMPAPGSIKIYFPNDVTQIDSILLGSICTNGTGCTQPPNGMNGTAPNGAFYENGRTEAYGLNPSGGPGIGDYNGEPQPRQLKNGTIVTVESPSVVPSWRSDGKQLWRDNTDYGFNGPNNKLFIGNKDYTNPDGWYDTKYIDALREYLNNPDPLQGCPNCRAVCTGYASSQGFGYANQELLKNRAESMKKWLMDNNILPENRIQIDTTKSKIKTGTYDSETPVDQKAVKEDRYGEIVFVNDKERVFVPQPDLVEEFQVNPFNLNEQVRNRYFTELNFFEKLQREDYFVFDKIREKIRYFHPAFHSMTPEGLNSRLTFLLQCTRQGPTLESTEKNPANLVFGAPPVCILRIGDFYNTKIMIDSLSIDYEPLVWDLNPEGVGVQPMIANVSLQFKYVGGSSLYSPINKLQNALSFNYFANTQVYDPRADYVAKVETIQSEKLIKDFPTDPALRKRQTLGATNTIDPKAVEEIRYALVPGLNSLTDSMGALVNEVSVFESDSTVNQVSESAGQNTQTTPTRPDPDSTLTAKDEPCVTNSTFLVLGDTPTAIALNNLKWIAGDNNTNYLNFYINSTDTSLAISQNYTVDISIINDRSKEKYTYKGIDLTQQILNSTPYTVIDDATEPKFPKPSVGNNDTYTMSVLLTGTGGIGSQTATACTIEFTQKIESVSVIGDDEFFNSVNAKLLNLEFNNVSFKLNSDKKAATPFYIKSRIKTDDGSESYEYVHVLETGFQDLTPEQRQQRAEEAAIGGIAQDAPQGSVQKLTYNGGQITFNVPFSATTPELKGLVKEKNYYLEPELFNDSGVSKVLNKIILDKTVASNEPKITGIKEVYYVAKQSVSDGPRLKIKLLTENVVDSIDNITLSDDVFKSFAENRVKLTVSSGSTTYENILPVKGNESSVTLAVGSFGTYFIINNNFDMLPLNTGQYDISVYYDNNLIQTVPVILGANTATVYPADGAQAQQSTNTNTPQGDANRDAKVIERIDIASVTKLDNRFDNSSIGINFTYNKKPETINDPNSDGPRFEDFDTFALSVSKYYDLILSIKPGKDYGDGTRKVVELGIFRVSRNNNESVIWNDAGEREYDQQVVGNLGDKNPKTGLKTYVEGSVWTGQWDAEDDDAGIALSKELLKMYNVAGTKLIITSKETGMSKEVDFNAISTGPALIPTDTQTPAPASAQTTSQINLPLVISDYFESPGDNCDLAHKYGKQIGVNLGKPMVDAINEAQMRLYKAGINPKITNFTTTITLNNRKYKTEYTITIDRSDDGKAWVGFATKGSCSDGYITRADGQMTGDTSILSPTSPCYKLPADGGPITYKKCLQNELGAVDFIDLPTYLNEGLEFKQYFLQFTTSDKPPK